MWKVFPTRCIERWVCVRVYVCVCVVVCMCVWVRLLDAFGHSFWTSYHYFGWSYAHFHVTTIIKCSTKRILIIMLHNFIACQKVCCETTQKWHKNLSLFLSFVLSFALPLDSSIKLLMKAPLSLPSANHLLSFFPSLSLSLSRSLSSFIHCNLSASLFYTQRLRYNHLFSTKSHFSSAIMRLFNDCVYSFVCQAVHGAVSLFHIIFITGHLAFRLLHISCLFPKSLSHTPHVTSYFEYNQRKCQKITHHQRWRERSRSMKCTHYLFGQLTNNFRPLTHFVYLFMLLAVSLSFFLFLLLFISQLSF